MHDSVSFFEYCICKTKKPTPNGAKQWHTPTNKDNHDVAMTDSHRRDEGHGMCMMVIIKVPRFTISYATSATHIQI